MSHTSTAHRLMHDLTSFFTPVLKSSRFVDEGVLTPEEFVASGDLLVRASPLWAWHAGDEGARKSWLPPDKQYLFIRGVPCPQRVSALQQAFERGGLAEEETEDGWVQAYAGQRADGELEEGAVLLTDDASGLLGHVQEEYEGGAAGAGGGAAGGAVADGGAGGAGGGRADDDDEGAAASGRGNGDVGAGDGGGDGDDDGDDDGGEYLDLMEFEGAVEDEAPGVGAAPALAQAVEPTAAIAAADTAAAFERRRTYDISIVYDKSYRTPRIFLFGYDEDNNALSPDHIMEDIVKDYANKTVTVEPHPHHPTGPVHAAIHPCRHAAAMKRIIDSLIASGVPRDDVAARVETYLFIFLKFVASVIPTIEYDSTIDVDVLGEEARAVVDQGGAAAGGATGL